MKQNISKRVFAGMLTILTIAGCDEKLDVSDQNSPLQESYFKTAAELQSGVNSVYSSIRGGNLMGREWFFLHDMRGGETAAGGVQLEQPRAELLNQPSPNSSNAVMTSVYTGLNQMINKANMVITKAQDVNDDVALRDRVVGEAKFLRAWAYFELVSQWGDVPMYTEPITSTTQFKTQSPAADIYALVISDLTAAAAALPESYTGADLGRVTKGAAYAMLGRVNMQKGDYEAARTALLNIYGKYTLVDNFLDNFDGDLNQSGVKAVGHEFNSESVFEVAFLDKGDANFNWGYNGEGSGNPVSTMRPQEYGIFWGNVIPSNRLLDEFEPGDPRFKFTFFEEGDMIKTKSGAGEVMTNADMNVAASVKDGDTKKRVFRKYSDLDWIKSDFHPGGFNQRVIRYADVLLMLAECEAEIGTPAKAADYINEVRARPSVNMPPVTLTSKNQALRAVMHERAVELAGEEVANIDILRWRKRNYFPSIMTDPKPGQAEFLPIPFAETSTNPEIK